MSQPIYSLRRMSSIAKKKTRIHQRGFTLIEALVALIILSVVIANVAQWIGTAQTTTVKIEQAHELPELFAQALQQVRKENLEKIRAGEYQLQNYTITWQATPLQQSESLLYRRQPLWNVTLFEVEFVFFKQGLQVATTRTKILGQWLSEG